MDQAVVPMEDCVYCYCDSSNPNRSTGPTSGCSAADPSPISGIGKAVQGDSNS